MHRQHEKAEGNDKVLFCLQIQYTTTSFAFKCKASVISLALHSLLKADVDIDMAVPVSCHFANNFLLSRKVDNFTDQNPITARIQPFKMIFTCRNQALVVYNYEINIKVFLSPVVFRRLTFLHELQRKLFLHFVTIQPCLNITLANLCTGPHTKINKSAFCVANMQIISCYKVLQETWRGDLLWSSQRLWRQWVLASTMQAFTQGRHCKSVLMEKLYTLLYIIRDKHFGQDQVGKGLKTCKPK